MSFFLLILLNVVLSPRDAPGEISGRTEFVWNISTGSGVREEDKNYPKVHGYELDLARPQLTICHYCYLKTLPFCTSMHLNLRFFEHEKK